MNFTFAVQYDDAKLNEVVPLAKVNGLSGNITLDVINHNDIVSNIAEKTADATFTFNLKELTDSIVEDAFLVSSPDTPFTLQSFIGKNYIDVVVYDKLTNSQIPSDYNSDTGILYVQHEDILNKYPVVTAIKSNGTIDTLAPKFTRNTSLVSYITSTGIINTTTNIDTLRWYLNPKAMTRVYLDQGAPSKSWNPLVYYGTVIKGDTVYTLDTPGPSTYKFKDLTASRISNYIYTIPVDDIDAYTIVTVYIDGNEIPSDAYMVSNHALYFNTPVERKSIVTVDISNYTGRWRYLYSLEFNPNTNFDDLRHNGEVPMVNNTFTFFQDTTSLYYTSSVTPGKFVEGTAKPSSLIDNRSNTAYTGGFKLFSITVNQTSKAATLIDIRRLGGGFKEDYLDTYDHRYSCTDYGLWDGAPLPNSKLLIRIPASLYTELESRFTDAQAALDYINNYAPFYNDTVRKKDFNALVTNSNTSKKDVVDFIIRSHIEQFLPAGINYTLEEKS